MKKKFFFKIYDKFKLPDKARMLSNSSMIGVGITMEGEIRN